MLELLSKNAKLNNTKERYFLKVGELYQLSNTLEVMTTNNKRCWLSSDEVFLVTELKIENCYATITILAKENKYTFRLYPARSETTIKLLSLYFKPLTDNKNQNDKST